MATIQLPPNSSGTRLRNIAAGVDSGEADAQEVVTLATVTGALVNPASEGTLAAILGAVDTLESLTADVKRGLTDYESRLDYDASNNLIYAGKAPNGTATTAATWQVQKLGYTAGNLTRVQVLSGIAWDSRASAGW